MSVDTVALPDLLLEAGREPLPQFDTSRSLHVAIVDEELPYPANSGKRIRTLNLLLPLAKRHRLTYIAHASAEPDETAQAIAYFRSQGIEPVLVDRRLPGKKGLGFFGRLLLNLVSPLPYSVQVHNSPRLQQAIRDFGRTCSVDLWHCEWTPYAESLRIASPGPWVAVAHNVESLIWQRYCETETSRCKRWYIRRQWKKFERFERRVFREAADVIAVSEADAQLARERFNAPRVTVVENGVDLASFRPTNTPRNASEILFLGSLDWRPNLDAVQILLDYIFPMVHTQEPQAKLLLVGRKPPQWLVDRVRHCEYAELHGNAADVRPFLHRCGAMVVPLRIGGGSRLKILEALAVQCPVISTRIGAEGLDLIPGEHYVERNDSAGIAAALVHAIREPRSIREMARLGHQVVRARYDWPILAEKLEAVWHARAQTPCLA